MSDANSEMSKVPGAELIPLSALLSLSSGFYDGRWIDGDSMAALVEECVRMAAPQAQPADALDAETIKKAARYDWLRSGNDYQSDGPMVVLYESEGDRGDRPYWSIASDALDASIDAAMAAAQEGGEELVRKDGA